mmetsp:Transcript_49634/g.153247  ORF Transcript_49634/g.153247 Transcript_49634/m.153247 type:complete len:210 (-) Transcript_49634:703-1332(-)
MQMSLRLPPSEEQPRRRRHPRPCAARAADAGCVPGAGAGADLLSFCHGMCAFSRAVAEWRQMHAAAGCAAQAGSACCARGSPGPRAGHRGCGVGVVSWTRPAVHLNEAPPLLVEDAVGVWPAARGEAANVMLVRTALAILPPLVGKLKNEPSAADTTSQCAVGHDLLREHRRRMRLGALVQALVQGVVGVGAKLPQEHGGRGEDLPPVE